MLELIWHFFTIITMHDYIPVLGGFIEEDSPLLDLAYTIAGI